MKVAEALQNGTMAEWLPRDLVSRVRRETHESFMRGQSGRLFMVVVLDAPGSELGLGLSAHQTGESDGLPFRTASLAGTYAGGTDGARPGSIPPGVTRAVSPEQAKLRALSSFVCYVVPLRKRVEAAFLNSISVGRARNHDVVLRHTSVSKFHANLEIEEGRLFIKDAGSRNHTFVNHERVSGRVEVQPGDNLRFGWVEALICTDEALWSSLRG